MSATVTSDDQRPAAPAFGRLTGTELRRLTARRFTRILLAVCVVGYLLAVAFLFQSHAQPTGSELAQATAQRDDQLTQITAQVKQCLAAPGGSEVSCGPVPTAADFLADQFLANTPFRPEQVPGYTVAVGAAVALAAFALGATFIGAEWSTRNVVAWLFYEPRRLRLMAAKLLAVSGAVLALSVLAKLVWAVTARWLINARGLPISGLGYAAPHFWSDVLGVQVRAALLVLPTVWLGYGLANLIRNTAAALGVAFVYLAVLESVICGISPSLQPYQFTTSLTTWVTRGGASSTETPSTTSNREASPPRKFTCPACTAASPCSSTPPSSWPCRWCCSAAATSPKNGRLTNEAVHQRLVDLGHIDASVTVHGSDGWQVGIENKVITRHNDTRLVWQTGKPGPSSLCNPAPPSKSPSEIGSSPSSPSTKSWHIRKRRFPPPRRRNLLPHRRQLRKQHRRLYHPDRPPPAT